jgi:DNA polymerase I
MFSIPDENTRIATVDGETTTFQKGNPFSKRNRLCSIGISDASGYSDYDIEYSALPYGAQLGEIKRRLEEAELVIGFNIKFDLHWLRRYIDDLDIALVWDCQLAEFILDGQSNPYPSLANTAAKYALRGKLDIVASEYWAKGIDTPEVPWDILTEYQQQDVVTTREVYEKQVEQFRHLPNLYNTFVMQCKDLLILQEAEFQGMLLDTELAAQRSKACEEEIESIKQQLAKLSGSTCINWNSPDHLSVFLYGGIISERVRVPTERKLKDGTIKVGEKWGLADIEFPRLVEPPKRGEHEATRGMPDEQLAALNRQRVEDGKRPIQRLWKTDEPTLRALNVKKKSLKQIIDLVLRFSELDKLNGTYYAGLPKKIVDMDWPDGQLHGNFNQVVVATGRLSSSNPNLQNLAGESKALYVSRYKGDERCL